MEKNPERRKGHSVLRWNKEKQGLETYDPNPENVILAERARCLKAVGSELEDYPPDCSRGGDNYHNGVHKGLEMALELIKGKRIEADKEEYGTLS